MTNELGGLYPLKYDGEYASLRFTRTGAQIMESAARRCAAIQKKIEQIDSRIADLDKDIPIALAKEAKHRAASKYPGPGLPGCHTPSDRYSDSSKLKRNKETEIGYKMKSNLEIAKLNLIIKNLSPDQVFDIEFAELVYFEGPWDL